MTVAWARVLAFFRVATPPLPPIRQTSEILSDLDQQVGRLLSVRERAVELMKTLEHDDQQE